MANPFQVICLSATPPDLFTSAFGPFVVNPCRNLGELSEALRAGACDALLIETRTPGDHERLLAWPGLAHAVIDAAVVVVSPEPTPAQCLKLLQVGVQDVVARREGGDDSLGRVLRIAIERKRMDASAKRAFSTDLTTGLPTHAQLLEHMTHLLALREREPAAMALIVLRLEGFRAAEQALGAEAANVLRRKAAVRLRAALRASDVVASLGGDMYGVLLAWIDAEADAEGVARKLLSSLRQPFNVAGQDLPVMGSVGIGQYPAHGRDAGSLMRRAMSQASNGNVSELGRVGAGAANDE
ncbi:MAG TPA: GGDEF domain-containing protein [Burkholderiaceae bacterium]